MTSVVLVVAAGDEVSFGSVGCAATFYLTRVLIDADVGRYALVPQLHQCIGVSMPKAKEIGGEHRVALLRTLTARFEAHLPRHAGLEWAAVQARLEANSAKLWSLSEMEQSGGEPDVIGVDTATGEFIFVDCSAQSPKGRRSVCYDRDALEARREHKPKSSAGDMAHAMGAALLTVTEYRQLQEIGQFDTTTSSWVETPINVRKLGGALFCDRRYDTVFVYHNKVRFVRRTSTSDPTRSIKLPACHKYCPLSVATAFRDYGLLK